MVSTRTIHIRTKGNVDIIDITPQVGEALKDAGVTDGIACACVVGSTAALTTCEFEPGLQQDIPEFLERIIPKGRYHHDDTWGDDNGHAHVRASLIGPSLSIPVLKGKLVLGTWQQIILIDMDTRARERAITVQFVGE